MTRRRFTITRPAIGRRKLFYFTTPDSRCFDLVRLPVCICCACQRRGFVTMRKELRKPMSQRPPGRDIYTPPSRKHRQRAPE